MYKTGIWRCFVAIATLLGLCAILMAIYSFGAGSVRAEDSDPSAHIEEIYNPISLPAERSFNSLLGVYDVNYWGQSTDSGTILFDEPIIPSGTQNRHTVHVEENGFLHIQVQSSGRILPFVLSDKYQNNLIQFNILTEVTLSIEAGTYEFYIDEELPDEIPIRIEANTTPLSHRATYIQTELSSTRADFLDRHFKEGGIIITTLASNPEIIDPIPTRFDTAQETPVILMDDDSNITLHEGWIGRDFQTFVCEQSDTPGISILSVQLSDTLTRDLACFFPVGRGGIVILSETVTAFRSDVRTPVFDTLLQKVTPENVSISLSDTYGTFEKLSNILIVILFITPLIPIYLYMKRRGLSESLINLGTITVAFGYIFSIIIAIFLITVPTIPYPATILNAYDKVKTALLIRDLPNPKQILLIWLFVLSSLALAVSILGSNKSHTNFKERLRKYFSKNKHLKALRVSVFLLISLIATLFITSWFSSFNSFLPSSSSTITEYRTFSTANTLSYTYQALLPQNDIPLPSSENITSEDNLYAKLVLNEEESDISILYSKYLGDFPYSVTTDDGQLSLLSMKKTDTTSLTSESIAEYDSETIGIDPLGFYTSRKLNMLPFRSYVEGYDPALQSYDLHITGNTSFYIYCGNELHAKLSFSDQNAAFGPDSITVSLTDQNGDTLYRKAIYDDYYTVGKTYTYPDITIDTETTPGVYTLTVFNGDLITYERYSPEETLLKQTYSNLLSTDIVLDRLEVNSNKVIFTSLDGSLLTHEPSEFYYKNFDSVTPSIGCFDLEKCYSLPSPEADINFIPDNTAILGSLLFLSPSSDTYFYPFTKLLVPIEEANDIAVVKYRSSIEHLDFLQKAELKVFTRNSPLLIDTPGS